MSPQTTGALGGGYVSSSSGGLKGAVPNGDQLGAGIAAGGGLLGGGTATVSFTNSTNLGSFVSADPDDLLLTMARETCNVITKQ